MTIPSELKKNEIYPARITGYTSEGAGVCRIGESAVFVPGTIVGEEWDVRIVRSTSAAVWGRGETLRSPSPHRAEPDCPAYPRCGGCALRHMDYEEELSLKLQRVNDALHRIGKLDFSVSGILPAPEDARQRPQGDLQCGRAKRPSRRRVLPRALARGRPRAGLPRRTEGSACVCADSS